MDQLEVAGEHARGEAEEMEQEQEQEGDLSAAMRTTAPADAVAETDSEAWRPPPGVFEFPWQKCRGGLGVPTGSTTAELRDVFFRSLVDGRVAVVGVPGDRLLPAPSKRALFDDLAAWLAAAGDGEVDPVWRSVLEGPRPAA
uniref:Uncharacterized protein n=6 Tax=Avena sativa TaxID=4498 RepID=A0ACD5V929_AVESA